MNYYEHHIGDYDKNTSHLTACEDGIYSRMIRRYMDKEKPLDVDTKEIKRIVRARNREEKSAVDTILKEFFQLESDGWHHKKCDETIAAYQAGEPEREVKKANEDNRLKKHREERASLFKQITDAGQHAPWNIGIAELRAMVERLTIGNTATPSKPLPATAPATPATATQSPLPTTHTPELTSKPILDDSSDSGSDRDHPSETMPIARNVQISLLLRAQGVLATPANPIVAVTWAQDPRVTDDVLNVAIAKARASKPAPEQIPVKYLARIVEQELTEQAAPPPAAKAKGEDWEWRRSKEGIERKGRELGMFARGGETHDSFRDRIQAALDKRKGQP